MFNIRSKVAAFLARVAGSLDSNSISKPADDVSFSVQTDPNIVPLGLYKSTRSAQPPTVLTVVFHGSAVLELFAKLQEKGGHKDTSSMFVTCLRKYEACLDAKERGNQVVEINANKQPVLRLI